MHHLVFKSPLKKSPLGHSIPHILFQLLARLGTGADDEKTTVVREALIELKLELRSLYSSLDAISGNEISANQLRSMEGIRHLLASLSERTRVLEEDIGDPTELAQDIVAGNVSARVRQANEGRSYLLER